MSLFASMLMIWPVSYNILLPSSFKILDILDLSLRKAGRSPIILGETSSEILMTHLHGEPKDTSSASSINAILSLVGYPRNRLLQSIRMTIQTLIPLRNFPLKVFNTTKASLVPSNGSFPLVNNIHCTTMTMGRFHAAPQEGHLTISNTSVDTYYK
jgi:hypothetical protein